MATSFPGTVQTFDKRLDLVEADAPLVKQYQEAMQNGDLSLAATILEKIPDHDKKLISAEFLNDMTDTIEAVETFFLERYTPGYVVSESQPSGQSNGDFWFHITKKL